MPDQADSAQDSNDNKEGGTQSVDGSQEGDAEKVAEETFGGLLEVTGSKEGKSLRESRQKVVEGAREPDKRKVKTAEELSQEIENDHRKADLEIKKGLAKKLLRLMVVQLAITDIVFVVYAWVGMHWKLPIGAVQVWVGATLLQLIAIVHTITKSLFPNNDGKQARKRKRRKKTK